MGSILVAALYFKGPLPGTYYVPNNFTNHNDFQISYWGFWTTKIAGVSQFYKKLGEDSGDFEIVEAPWNFHWGLTIFHHYQKVHKKLVRIGFVGKLVERYTASEFNLNDPNLDFQRYVDLQQPETFREKNIRYVILHKDLHSEVGDEFKTPNNEVERIVELYQESFGPPLFEDETIVVFSVN